MQQLVISERTRKSLRSEWFRLEAKALKLRAELDVIEASKAGLTAMLGSEPVAQQEAA